MKIETINNKEQFTVAVIDDSLKGRKQYYNVLLKPFNIIYVLEQCYANEVVKLEADFFIIDLILWDGDDKESLEMVRAIYEKTKKPVFIVSKNFTKTIDNLLSETYKFNEYSNVIGYLDWQNIKSMEEPMRLETIKRWQTGITVGFNRYKQYNMTPISKDRPIKLLHFGDMQFGGPVSDVAEGDYMTIARKIKKDGQPDLMVITGDIAQYGTKENYVAAGEWMKKFCIAIWDDFETNRDRILIVPGNHDCNMRAFAKTRFGYESKMEDCDSVPARKNKLFPFIDNQNGHVNINYNGIDGYRDFCRFAYELTKDLRWLTQENSLNFITDRFLRWGIRFVHLFTHTMIKPEDTSGFGMDTGSMEKIANNIFLEGSKKTLYTILLSHGSPPDFGLKDGHADSDTIWCKVRQYIENIQPNLFLYGHIHSYRAGLLEDRHAGPFIKNTVAVRTGSLRLNATGLGPDDRRCFNIITLERKDYKVNAIHVQNYDINGLNIEPNEEPYDNSNIYYG